MAMMSEVLVCMYIFASKRDRDRCEYKAKRWCHGVWEPLGAPF